MGAARRRQRGEAGACAAVRGSNMGCCCNYKVLPYNLKNVARRDTPTNQPDRPAD
jgi:hypothetical protein